jgi:XTP/dITP diphosphohydrolase
MNIIIATGNRNKYEEIYCIFQNESRYPWKLNPLPKGAEPNEPFSSFLENTRHKAKYYGDKLNSISLSDDTGLCIPSLNQYPGVRTKEFVKECGSMNNAIEQLELKLAHTHPKNATYACACALYIPSLDLMWSFEALEHGTLQFPRKGKDGFGFDSIFVPNGQYKTLAELGSSFKNKYSHRAMAIKGVLAQCSIELEKTSLMPT